MRGFFLWEDGSFLKMRFQIHESTDFQLRFALNVISFTRRLTHLAFG